MKQMTIRTIDPELEKGIEELCLTKKWPVNQVAIYLMRKGLGLSDKAAPDQIGDRLDGFFGVWSEQEAREFDRAIEDEFNRIDPDPFG